MNNENLIPQNMRTKEEQREIARLGGIASGRARKEKKLMSQIMADFLSKEHYVTVNDKKIKMSGSEQINIVMADILDRRDSASVSLLKTMAETTEGSKVDLIAAVKTPVQITIEGVEPESTDPSETDTNIQE